MGCKYCWSRIEEIRAVGIDVSRLSKSTGGYNGRSKPGIEKSGIETTIVEDLSQLLV